MRHIVLRSFAIPKFLVTSSQEQRPIREAGRGIMPARTFLGIAQLDQQAQRLLAELNVREATWPEVRKVQRVRIQELAGEYQKLVTRRESIQESAGKQKAEIAALEQESGRHAPAEPTDELRAAIEIQAATLAAERVSPPDVSRIEQALRAIDSAIARGEAAIREDFAFHRAIAAATGNPRFSEFLEFLGRHVIPRQSIRVAIDTPDERRRYLARIQGEHRRIFAAIQERDPSGARKAMRAHLTRSIERYRRLAARRPTT